MSLIGSAPFPHGLPNTSRRYLVSAAFLPSPIPVSSLPQDLTGQTLACVMVWKFSLCSETVLPALSLGERRGTKVQAVPWSVRLAGVLISGADLFKASEVHGVAGPLRKESQDCPHHPLGR